MKLVHDWMVMWKCQFSHVFNDDRIDAKYHKRLKKKNKSFPSSQGPSLEKVLGAKSRWLGR